MRNTFGTLLTLTTFGESHGEAIGGIVDGYPAGIDIDLEFIQNELNRRRPGQSSLTTSRQETDSVELLSGVFEGQSTGSPIGFVIRNSDQHSGDYDDMRNLFRPSHADFTYFQKFGLRDYRGGGRSSARITVARCVGGALAKLALKQLGITVKAYVSQVATSPWNTVTGITISQRPRPTAYVAPIPRRPNVWQPHSAHKNSGKHSRRYRYLHYSGLPCELGRTRIR